ncbi:MAG: response regulator, partial [Methanosarcinales archaeon]
ILGIIMTMDKIDKKILEILQEKEDTPYNEIAEKLGITESDVQERLERLSDTRTKILVVDDELDTLIPLRMALEAENYAVVEAQDGLEALEKVYSENPDLILLDIMLPRMDGYEVCQKLKADEKTNFIPIIMLTAKGEIQDKIEGIDIGADDYVTKPFNLDELKARIKMVLRRVGA